jgi:hypothetical protein
LIFQNQIIYLDDLIIIQVGFQSLNLNTKYIERENHFNLIFFKPYNLCIVNQLFSNSVDIDNLCGPKKIQKKPTQQLLKKSNNMPTLVSIAHLHVDFGPLEW